MVTLNVDLGVAIFVSVLSSLCVLASAAHADRSTFTSAPPLFSNRAPSNVIARADATEHARIVCGVSRPRPSVRCRVRLPTGILSATESRTALAKVCEQDLPCKKSSFAFAFACSARGISLSRHCHRLAASSPVNVAQGTQPNYALEGTFVVETESRRGPVQVIVEVARFRLSAQIVLVQASSYEHGYLSQDHVSPERLHLHVSQVSTMQVKVASMFTFFRGVPGVASTEHVDSLLIPPHVMDAARKARRVRVEVGAQPEGRNKEWMLPDPAEFVVTLDPHLRSWARRTCSFKQANGATSLQSQPPGVALPFAVGETMSGETCLRLDSLVPFALKENEACAENPTVCARMDNQIGGKSCHAVENRSSWSVPRVSLHWVMFSLLPHLVPNASHISLDIRQRATAGHPTTVIFDAISAAERRHLSAFSIEWTPDSPNTCVEIVSNLIEEGHARAGPVRCREGAPTMLSFIRAVGAADPDPKSFDEVDQRMSRDTLADQFFLIFLQHRFPVSVGDGISDDVAALVPDFYRIWIEASSSRSIARNTLGAKLGLPGNNAVFLVTLEPRIHEWTRVLASDEVGNSDVANNLQPPGWVNSRHIALPGSVYHNLEEPSNVVSVPIPWALQMFVGERTRNVDVLVLRDPLYDVTPWATAGRGARRFKQVHVEGGANAADACSRSMTIARSLGYSVLRGACPESADTSSDSTPGVVFVLVFERMDVK